MKSFFESLDQSPWWLILSIFCGCLWIVGFVNTEFVATDDLYETYFNEKAQEKYGDYDELAEEFEDDLEEIEDESALQEMFLELAFITILNSLKFVIIAGFIWVGITVIEDNDLTFNSTFKVVVISEFVFFLPKIIGLIWFLGFVEDYDLTQIQKFNPLSILSIVGYDETIEWLRYPLKTLNLFEVGYIGILTIGISFFSNNTPNKTVVNVVLSYGSFLALVFTIRIYLSTII